MEEGISIVTSKNTPHLDVLYEHFPIVKCGTTAVVRNADGTTKRFRHNKGTWLEIEDVKIKKSKKMK